MSKYTLIESELSQINDAKFQVVCNAFLVKEYEGDIHSPGMVIGKEKTSKGRPDTFVFRKDNRFLLAEYTTKDKSDSKQKFFEKLENDLKGCLDFEKIGIESKDVSEIILCCNSDVDPSEIIKLKVYTDFYGIDLRVIGIRTLTLHFLYKDRYFVHQFLNIPFDSGQMLSKSEFLKQYSKKNFSTPLDNIMIGRKRELNALVKAINTNQIIIVKGTPGIGKSRLVLQVIDEYLKENPSFIPYYFMRKGGSILEDILTYIEPDKSYIFFLDDVNRQIDNFLDAVNTLLEKENGQIKILVTVRDYAKAEIIKKCRDLQPYIYTIDKLPNDVIRKILTGKDFNIHENIIVERIIEVCNGNPRLAIMSARIAKNAASVNLLKDVSNIYDEYFQGIIDDHQVFTDKNIFKAIGILSFLQSIDLEDERDWILINYFGFSYGEFVDVVHKLEEVEMVEVYLKYTVKMSEQVMSTYFFYRVFFKDRLIQFSDLLNYFKEYDWRFRDSFDSANTAFGTANVAGVVMPDLLHYYQKIKSNGADSMEFLSVFGRYMPNSTFQFVNNKLEKLSNEIEDRVEYKKATHFDFENILELLEFYYKSPDNYEISIALDLSILYIIKRPLIYGALLSKLSENYQVSIFDLNENLRRQKHVYKQLLSSINERKIYALLFFDLFSSVLLKKRYDDIFYEIYKEKWVLKKDFRELRNQFWTELADNYELHCDTVTNVLVDYFETMGYAGVEIDEDVTLVILFINNRLKPERFGDCYFVHKYIQTAIKRGILNEHFNQLKEKFSSFCYRVFSFLTWGKLDLYEIHKQLKEWWNVEEYKVKILKRDLHVSTLKEFDEINKCIHEISNYKFCSEYSLAPGLDVFFSNIIYEDTTLGFKCLRKYLEDGNVSRLLPTKILKAVFSLGEELNMSFYRLISKANYLDADKWVERYFDFLPDRFVDTKQTENLLKFYKKRESGVELESRQFDKFLTIEGNIYEIILNAEVDKRRKNQNYIYKLSCGFLKNNISLVASNLSLCKEAYFQQEEIDREFDSDADVFFVLFEKENEIINEYIDFIHRNKKRYVFLGHFKMLVRVWEYSNAEDIIFAGLRKIKYVSEAFDHLAAIFFRNLDKKYHDRAYELLCKIMSEFSDDENLINLTLDVTRNCLKKYYHKLIQYFLSINNDVEKFKKLQFYNNHFSSDGNQIWADFRAAVLRGIYNAIRELPNRKIFLSHLDYLEGEIYKEEKNGIWERKMRFRGYQ